MTLNQYLGDSVAHEVPLRWNRAAFEPGSDWLLIFTAKVDGADLDEDAVIQKTSGIGITVSGSTATVATVPADTVDLAARELVWDIQAQHVETGAVRTVAAGTLRLGRDATRLTETSIPIFTTEPPAPAGPEGPIGPAGPSTTAAILAALAANPLTNAEKATMAAALGTPVYASLSLANAGLGAIGRVFWNSTNHRYEVTSDIA